MSKSHGVFFTPEQWLEIAEPETLNYFIFRNKPLKHKDFDPTMPFLDFIEQYDRVERIYYSAEEPTSDKEGEKLKKIYEASQINLEESMPFQPSYRFLTVAYQIAGNDPSKIYEILKKNSQLPKEMEAKDFKEMETKDLEKFTRRIEHVKNWLETYAPEFVKFQVQKKLPRVEINDEQKEFLLKVADLLEKKDYDTEEFYDEMYLVIHDLDMKPQKAFQAIYKVITGKKQGPRAASFVLSLDKDLVIRRFRMND
jgi:lysyl-tRNA synthetase class 1